MNEFDSRRTLRRQKGSVRVRDVRLYVEVLGQGPPLLLMHGGPGLDHVSLEPLRKLADRFTVVMYDHRCNGRSIGPAVTSMTWDNLTADADALREALGFERWAVLGHSFGGHVALEYVLRYPERVSQLILLDTAGDAWWSQENGPEVLAGRGFSPETVAVARRFYSGRIGPKDFFRAAMRLVPAYDHRFRMLRLAREMLEGGWRMKTRPEALVFGGRMMRGWTVMDRLGEISAPTLVLAGHDDFLFPPESQALLAKGIPNARLRIIERAGHNPQSERPAETLAAVRDFLTGAPSRTAAARTRLDDVYVHESGASTSPAVVFIHGGGPSGPMWRDHLDRLAGQFHCLAPDLPGFGCSNELKPVSLSQTADLLAELIEARVPARRAHVVGLSYGGSVAFAMLDRHPEVLDRVVIDGASVIPGRLDPLILATIVLVSPFVNTPVAAAVLRLVGLRDLGVALRSASPAAFRRSWFEGYTAPISRRALEATCPTLLVAGGREQARASNAGVAALMPHAIARYVPGLGHAWFIWRRELHLRMVEAWLTGTDLPTGLETEPASPAAAEHVLRQLPDMPASMLQSVRARVEEVHLPGSAI